MKLEPNMYVRTKYGTIRKLVEDLRKDSVYHNMQHFKTDKLNEYRGVPSYILYKEDIDKASHNIIDLIKTGDYVNGCFVLEKDSKFIVVNGLDNYGFGQGVIPIEDIKSIVTKEQFESMKYSLEG